MRRLTQWVTFPILVSFFMGVSYSQEQKVNPKIWSIHYWQKMAKLGLVEVAKEQPVPAAKYTGSTTNARTVLIDDSPDVPVTTNPNTTQSENSIFVNTLDNSKALNSNNSTDFPVTTVLGASGFVTSDAGLTWAGQIQGTGGTNGGDPAAAIDLSGRYYVGYIANNDGQGVANSTDEGQTWAHVQVAPIPGPGGLADKNHLWVDNSPSSPHEGNLYSAWTAFGGPDDTEIAISRSTDGGLSWSSPLNISSAVSAGSHNQGVNIKTGPNGEVYVAWSIYDSFPQDEVAIGFAKSTDGGSTFDPATRIITNTRGIRSTGTSKNHRVAAFPVMAVDITGGPRNGQIYVVWTNIGFPGINVGPDIDNYLIKSTDGGATWSSPVKVNQDASGLGKEHYFPWITCDPVTGALSVISYDDRNVSSTECEVFVANSIDGGDTWEDFKVSDVSFTPSPIPGLAGSYFGDYLGISARGGKVYPCWTDNRSGTALTYVSPFTLADPEDPNPPANASAYSDYTTPTSMLITWTDPTNFVNGDTLFSTDFTIEIERDGNPLASILGGVEQYVDTGLTDGQQYSYSLFTNVNLNDSTSLPVSLRWTAGGSPTPSAPASFFVTESSIDTNDFVMHWTNPSTNIDGTPMDDFAGINLYEDGSLVSTFNRTTADTSVVDSALYTPPVGTHRYHVTAIDNEIPQNESGPSNSGFTPVSYPFSEGFEAGLGNFVNDPTNGVDWTTTTSFFVGGMASALNAYGSNNSNVVELSGALDLTGASGAKLAFYQICKTEGGFDFGYVEYSTNGGVTWASFPLNSYEGLSNYTNERFHEDSYPLWGTTDVPPMNNWWQLEIFDLAAFVGETNFKIRFRLNTDGSVLRYGWLIDNVYIGPPIATPLMSVSPTVLEDTLLVGETGMHSVTVSNNQIQLSTLNYMVTENPPVSWLSIDTVSGTVASGQSEIMNVTLDATGLPAANYTTELIVAGNDSSNLEDTVVVTLQVNEPPIVGFSPDSMSFVLGPAQVDSMTMTILNAGAGPLTFTLTDEDVFTAKVLKQTSRKITNSQAQLSVEVPKGEEDKRRGSTPINGIGGPDNFGYRWIDSDALGGPTFNWQDITGSGTPVNLGDDTFMEVALPFTFSFYGIDQDLIKITSNGYLTFGPDGMDFSNDPIPNPVDPNDIICPFWDDLNPADGGTIHYFGSPTEFTVQYTDVPHYSGAGVLGLYTFQVILNRNGTVLYQYLDMRQTITSATIGIENVDASDGLEVVFNAPYMHDSLAVRISAESGWLSENPNSGTVPPGGSVDVQVIANSTGLSGGDHIAKVVIKSNDPITPETSLPVRMTVGGIPVIQITPDSLVYVSLLAGDSSVHQLNVSNVGTFPLTISDIISTNMAFSVDTSSFLVPPLSSQIVSVKFAPPDTGSFTGLLRIASDDPATDTVDVYVSGVAAPAPILGISPDSLSFALGADQVDSLKMTIINSGGGVLDFSLTDEYVFSPARERQVKSYQVELSVVVPKGMEDGRQGFSPPVGMGGPDNFGYRWIDSDEPGGPVFKWQDVTTSGTPVTLSDDDSIHISLPFTFNFYGVDHSIVKITSNGYLTFGSDGTDFSNDPIPDPLDPNDIICPFWDDLNPADGGTIHYLASASEFVVQYTDIPHFSGGGVLGLYTFQVILNDNGSILYQYLDMQQTLNSATIGIENANATDGLEVIFNASYMHDSLAIRIAADTPWLSENPTSGSVPPGDSVNVQVIVNTAGLTPGQYRARVIVNSNDPSTPSASMPISLDVGTVGVSEATTEIPTTFELRQNYPNPFNPVTRIEFALPVEAQVSLRVYNLLGQEVITLVDEQRPAGYFAVEWDGKTASASAASSGIYFYRLEARASQASREFNSLKKMILLK